MAKEVMIDDKMVSL